MKYILATLLSVLAIQAMLADEHWDQFRDPQGNGMSAAENLPVEFDEAKNVRWKVAIPDKGWSSPVIPSPVGGSRCQTAVRRPRSRSLHFIGSSH